MTATTRRLALGIVLGAETTVAGLAAVPGAAQSCDPAYISHCVPPIKALPDPG